MASYLACDRQPFFSVQMHYRVVLRDLTTAKAGLKYREIRGETLPATLLVGDPADL